MSISGYYSLDDILVTNERVPCKLNLTIPKLGKLDPSSDSDDLEIDSKLDLPVWLASPLSNGRYPMVTVELPRSFNDTYRKILQADATIVNLNKLNMNFYEFGIYVTKFDQRDVVRETITETFQNRFRRLMDLSSNNKRSLKIIEKFDNLERDLYNCSYKAQSKMQTWLFESQVKLHAADLVISHRKRKRDFLNDNDT